MTGKVGYLKGLVALIVGCLGGPVMQVDIDGVAKRYSNWVVDLGF